LYNNIQKLLKIVDLKLTAHCEHILPTTFCLQSHCPIASHPRSRDPFSSQLQAENEKQARW